MKALVLLLIALCSTSSQTVEADSTELLNGQRTKSVTHTNNDINVFAAEDPEDSGSSSSGAIPRTPQESNIWKDRQSLSHPPRPQMIRRRNPYQTRIIGGTKAPQNRYPYIVAIFTEGGSESMAPICGGSLIAPQMVLTAAHCYPSRLRTVRIGSRDDENSERFDIVEQIRHPQYHPDRLDHDIMILVLSESSRHAPIPLNRDPAIPNPSKDNNEYHILGYGVTQINGGGLVSATSSASLQIGTVHHVPNTVCEKSSVSDGTEDGSYQGEITEDMMCAAADGVDACQGDSGSALIRKGDGVGHDVLVGVTSWGFRCAHPDFPGVYARVSYVWKWIAGQVCERSSFNNSPPAPAAFKCHAVDTHTLMEEGDEAGMMDPIIQQSSVVPPVTIESSNLVPVTLKILFDGYASEIGWKLLDDSGVVIASVPIEFYANGRLRAIRTFFLPRGKSYSFQIEDSYQDGMSTAGNYIITAGRTAEHSSSRLILFGKGDFGALARHEFQVPDLENDDGMILGGSTNSVTAANSNEVTASLQTQVGIISFSVVLQLDDNPTNIGWVLERVGFHTEVVARMTPGAYQQPSEEVTISLDLEEDELYRFTLLNPQGIGIDGGSVRLFLGEQDVSGNAAPLIFDHNGSFGSSLDHSFFASFSDVTDPLVAYSADNTGDYLTIELRLDLYPEEIGFQIRAETITGAIAIEKRASNVVFFRPPGFYNISHANQIVREKIHLPLRARSSGHFSLIVMDIFGDGLCCKWQGGLGNTGYTLYMGDPEHGKELVASSFSSTARESYSFNIAKGEGQPGNAVSIDAIPASVLPMGEVIVRLIMVLDKFPEQTGYSIIDIEGRIVADLPPGSYRDVDATVVEDHVLSPGIYTLTVVDSNGDGITTEAASGAYRLILVDRLSGPPVVSGDGNFQEQQEHTFVLEGNHASVPVLIKIDGGSDELEAFGFQVTRLDLAEANAVVAQVSPGPTTVAQSLIVEEGGLYQLSLFGTGSTTSLGKTRIAIGSHKNFQEVDIEKAPKFLASSSGDMAIDNSHVKEGAFFLSLSIPHHLHSHGLDWVLVMLDLEAWGSERKAYTKRTAIAYGPNSNNQQNQHDDAKDDIATISLPVFDGKQAFMLVVTHSAGSECCTVAMDASLIQLYQGLPEDNVVLIGTSFEGESRLVEIFHLVASQAESVTSNSFLGTGVIVGALLLVCAYVVYRMYKK